VLAWLLEIHFWCLRTSPYMFISDKRGQPTPHLEFSSAAVNVVSCGE